MRLRFLPILAMSITATTVACSTVPDGAGELTEEEMLTAGASAAEACGDTFRPAFRHYKAAVNGAKARETERFICESEGFRAILLTIADEAASAVLTCPAFKDVIRTSPFAEPIRKALGASLTLKALTGELLVLRDSPFQNWSGVDSMIAGTTMSTELEGVAAKHSRIEFAANGAATYVTRDDPAPTFESVTTTQRATWRLEKTGGEAAPRTMKVTREDGKSATFRLAVMALPADDFSSAPTFQLVPVSGDLAAFASPGEFHFRSLIDECGGL